MSTSFKVHMAFCAFISCWVKTFCFSQCLIIVSFRFHQDRNLCFHFHTYPHIPRRHPRTLRSKLVHVTGWIALQRNMLISPHYVRNFIKNKPSDEALKMKIAATNPRRLYPSGTITSHLQCFFLLTFKGEQIAASRPHPPFHTSPNSSWDCSMYGVSRRCSFGSRSMYESSWRSDVSLSLSSLFSSPSGSDSSWSCSPSRSDLSEYRSGSFKWSLSLNL